MRIVIPHERFAGKLTISPLIIQAPGNLFLQGQMQTVCGASGEIMQIRADAQKKIVSSFDLTLVRLAQPIFSYQVMRCQLAFSEKCHPEQVLIIAQTAAAVFHIRFLHVNAIAKFLVARKLVPHPQFDVFAFVTGHAFGSKLFPKFPRKIDIARQKPRLEHRRFGLHVLVGLRDCFPD